MKRDIFQAIADPTRRDILLFLAETPQNINTLSEKFDMTRQAVSLHIKVLQECEVITVKKEGRQRQCALKVEKLAEVAEWLEPFRKMWEKRFNQLDSLLAELQSNKRENSNDK